MRAKKPSLRHYAVTERLSRTIWGSIWEISDRRSKGLGRLFLFQPSRLRCWPRYLAIFEELNPVPVRLRNRNVALLMSVSDWSSMESLIKTRKSSKRIEFNPIVGFQPIERKRLLPVLIATACICIVTVIITIEISNKPKAIEFIPTQHQLCSTIPKIGSVTDLELERGAVTIANDKFRISTHNLLGGFTKVTLKRLCDGKYFSVKGWISKDGLTIGSLY